MARWWFLWMVVFLPLGLACGTAEDDHDHHAAHGESPWSVASPETASEATPDPDGISLPPPAVQWRPCDDFLPALLAPFLPEATTCGTVAAPVDYQSPGERLLNIRFVVVPSRAPKADVLAINLGGPASNLRNLALFAANPQGPFAVELRDRFHLLFVETRGAALSSTPLICPDALAWRWWRDLDEYRTLVRACLDGLPHDVSPAFMSTVDAARDLEMVRRALGVDRLRLLGASYGSRLMLEYLRRYGDRVAAFVLDSTLPPQDDGRHDLDRILRTLADDCDADPACPLAAGDELWTRTAAAVNDGALGRKLTVDLFHLGNQPAFLATWPAALAAAAAGDETALESWHQEAFWRRGLATKLSSFGHWFDFDPYADNVMCIDFPGWNRFTDQAYVLDRLTPPYRELAAIEATTAIACEELAATFARAPDVDRAAVVSDVPGLLIAPRFDQATPWTDAVAAVADGLTGATVLPVNADHAVLIHLDSPVLDWSETDRFCLRGLLADWLAAPFDPADRACVADLAVPLSFAALPSSP